MNAEPNMTLDVDECWDCLRSTTIGCLAVVVGEGADLHPDIFPVNYAIEHSSVVFRSGGGTKIAAIHDHPQVAFEVDHVAGGRAWSVIVRGHARTLTDPQELARFERLGLRPWLDTEKLEVVEIDPYKVTGRRFSLQG